MIASQSEPLASDAQSFISQASYITSRVDWLPRLDKSGVDLGYPILLSGVIKLFGDNIYLLQTLNYILWLFSALLIYYATQRNKQIFLLMLFSPVYLTFSLKLFSEPLASLGVSLIIYSFSQTKIGALKILSSFYASLVLIPSKVISIVFILLLVLFSIAKKNIIGISLLLGLILMLPLWQKSANGGRGQYTLAVQTAKLTHSYKEILSCIPYNISWPVGKMLFPDNQNICILFAARKDLPSYDINPVVIADKTITMNYPISHYLSLMILNPFKFALIILVDSLNLVLFEGFYANILSQLPFLIQVPLYIYGKLLSIAIWYYLFILFRNRPIFTLPIMLFILTHGLTHIEQRYFYPLFPLIYYYLYISWNSLVYKKI